MEGVLITARIVNFAASISLMGVFGFECFVAGPAFRQCGVAVAAVAVLRRRVWWLAWASLGLALVSGAAWLAATAAEMSGQSLAVAMSQGVVGTVLTETRFGEVWLLRLSLAVPLALCILALSAGRVHTFRAIAWTALVLGGLMLASLAWAGHGAATPGEAGVLQLAGDILHLLGAGLWLGTLPPLALLLAEGWRVGDATWVAVASTATRRYSTLAMVSVTILLVGGLSNTWFLAGTVPALVGTRYGQLLLTKIGLFLAMLMVAAVNLFRLTPRLAVSGALTAAWRTVAQLRRNALIEASIGLGVVAIVGALGILPPGLHTQPGWPFPFRFEISALTLAAKILLAILAAVICAGVIATAAAAAAGRYRRAAVLCAALALCAAIAWVPLRPAIESAYPTTFYAPAVPYGAASIVQGAALYQQNCANCHGTDGRGGPGAVGLPIRPANLVEPRIFFADTPGDLFWSVSQGRSKGAMPGFANVMTPEQRWDVINFIRARAAGVLSAGVGLKFTTASVPAIPDFAFEMSDMQNMQNTLNRVLKTGPVLLVLFTPPAPSAGLGELATAQSRLAAAGLKVITVELGTSSKQSPENAAAKPPDVVDVSDDVVAALQLFRSPDDGGETELLLDRNGNIRARWTANEAGGLAPLDELVAEAKLVAAVAVAAPSHAGHGM